MVHFWQRMLYCNAKIYMFLLCAKLKSHEASHIFPMQKKHALMIFDIPASMSYRHTKKW